MKFNLNNGIHQSFKDLRDQQKIWSEFWYIDESEKLANEILQKLKNRIREIPEIIQLQILMLKKNIENKLDQLHIRLDEIINYHK